MKKIIYLTLLFTGIIYSNLFATTYVIDGCTRPAGYSYVRAQGGYVHCLGIGNLRCGVSEGLLESTTHKTYLSDEIVDYVFSQIENGRYDGDVLYMDDLPVTWNVQNGKVVTIDIKDSGKNGFKDIELKE